MSDIRLHYIERGNGDPLILLHGNGENSNYFANQIRYFSRSRRVIAIDTRGHGKSPRGTAPFTIRQFVEDLNGFMDEQGIKKADILGFSDGGNIALLFAIRFPQKIRRLILNGANLYPSGMKVWVVLPIWAGYGIASLLAPYSRRVTVQKELLGLMVKDPYIPLSDLKKLKIPTLVIAGEHDMIRHRHSCLIAKMIPQARFICLRGDHFVARKNPEEFNKVVERFLK